MDLGAPLATVYQVASTWTMGDDDGGADRMDLINAISDANLHRLKIFFTRSAALAWLADDAADFYSIYAGHAEVLSRSSPELAVPPLIWRTEQRGGRVEHLDVFIDGLGEDRWHGRLYRLDLYS